MAVVDAVIVKPGSQAALYGKLGAYGLTAIEPPLWPALIAAFLRERGYEVVLLDAEAEGWDERETARRIAECGARLAIAGVSGTNPSASTMNMTGVRGMFAHLAECAPELPRLVMGLHPSALPEQTLREEPVDYVCRGEGFHTLPPLLDALRAGAPPGAVPGLWRRDGATIYPADYPPAWEDLGVLPRPAWELLPMDKYRAHNWHCFGDIDRRAPYGVLYTSLGCPFRCSFCCINALFGGRHRLRRRPVERVLEDLDFQVGRFGIRNFKILDELFAIHEGEVTRLCDAIAGRGYDLNLWAYARVDTVTPRMLAAMRRAGIRWVAYGFESGNRRVLREAEKGYDPARALEVARMTYDEGLHICANFIFGLPEDDFDSMQETLDLATRINAEWCNLYPVMAFPGSALYEQALAEGWPLPEHWSGYSPYSYDCQPLPTRHLSPADVVAFRDYAFAAYHRNPRYLALLERKFGRATADYMRLTTRHTPRRRLLETANGGEAGPPP